MEFFPSSKVFLAIGSLQIRWYAVLILMGIGAAYFFTKKDMKEIRYMDEDDYLDDFIFTILITGIIGARVWYCAFYDFNYYISNPVAILRIFDGGLAIQGGLIFGFVAALIFTHKKNTSFLKTLDCLMPNVLLAQAFGRWGNYINQECHGPAVEESYFDGILSFLKEGMCINGTYYMPMFFFESCLCVMGFLLIRYVMKPKCTHKRGDLTWCYFMWYGIIRLYIESLRTDSLMIGPFKIAQVISILFVLGGILGYIGAFEKIISSKSKLPTILFDFDGTLADTDKAILSSYRHCFEKFDDVKNFTPEREKEVLGPALREIFPKYFPNVPYEEVLHEYETYQESILDEVEEKKNAGMVLQKLHEEGYSIGIVSTRRKSGIELRLKILGLEEYVNDIYGLNEVENLKPNPEAVFKIIKANHWNRDDVIYVGDNVSDVMCGNNYGAYTIAYVDRKEKEEELRNSVANTCISDLAEILEIVDKKGYFTYNLK